MLTACYTTNDKSRTVYFHPCMQRKPQIIDVFLEIDQQKIGLVNYMLCDMTPDTLWMTWFCMLHSIFWSFLIGSNCVSRMPPLSDKSAGWMCGIWDVFGCKYSNQSQIRCHGYNSSPSPFSSHIVVTVTASQVHACDLSENALQGLNNVDTGPIDLLHQALSDTETCLDYSAHCFTLHSVGLHCISVMMISYCISSWTCTIQYNRPAIKRVYETFWNVYEKQKRR